MYLSGITDYMDKQSGEAAKLLPTMKDVKKIFVKELPTVIGFFDNLESENLKTYMEYGECNIAGIVGDLHL